MSLCFNSGQKKKSTITTKLLPSISKVVIRFSLCSHLCFVYYYDVFSSSLCYTHPWWIVVAAIEFVMRFSVRVWYFLASHLVSFCNSLSHFFGFVVLFVILAKERERERVFGGTCKCFVSLSFILLRVYKCLFLLLLLLLL